MNRLTILNKISKGLKSSDKKVVTIDVLNAYVILKEDIILDELSFFEPLIRLTPSFNIRRIEKEINNEIIRLKNNKKEKNKSKTVNKRKKIDSYDTLLDFIEQKMLLPGGIIDVSYTFTLDDLKALRKVVNKNIKEWKE